MPSMKKRFLKAFRGLQSYMHATALAKGFWDNLVAPSETVPIAWAHAGLSALLDTFRTGKPVQPAAPKIGNARADYFALKISLVHSELSEALEGWGEQSDKIPQFSSPEEELADAIIRMMDMAEYYGWDLAGAVVAKMEYNESRSRMHGGKKF
jgi:hypothetical protein